MEGETILAVTKSAPSSVAVEAIGPGRFLAAWSADEETFVAELEQNSSIRGNALRVKKSCGGTAIAEPDQGDAPKAFWPENERSSINSEDLALTFMEGGSAALVMIEHPRENEPGGVYAALIGLSSRNEPEAIKIGKVSDRVNRIAAAKCGRDLIAAWHEGGMDSSRVNLARLGLKPLRVEKTGRLDRSGSLSNPSLSRSGECALIAWLQTLRTDNRNANLIKVAALSPDLEVGAVMEAAGTLIADPDPRLSQMDDRVGLVFRDDEDKDDIAEFYFTLVGRNGKPIVQTKRISQADGWRGPSLIYNAPNFVSAAIRSFQRNLLIGVNRFDSKGAKMGGEFQVYADKSDFTRVDLAVSAESIVMIYAEDRHGTGRVLAGQIKCGSER